MPGNYGIRWNEPSIEDEIPIILSLDELIKGCRNRGTHQYVPKEYTNIYKEL